MKEQRMRRGALLATIGLLGVFAENSGIAASPEPAVHANPSRAAFCDRLSNELSSSLIVQDNVREVAVSASQDSDLGVYLDLHQWAAGSLLGNPPADRRDGTARSN